MATRRDLTQRDLDLLEALATERTMTDVADAMFLSQRQTRRLVSNLVERMGVASSRAAVAVVAAQGWISEPESNLSRTHPSDRGRQPSASSGSVSRDLAVPRPNQQERDGWSHMDT